MARLVKRRLKWAGHVERMKEDRLPRMAYVHQERGKRKRGRPRMRWRDCIERDMRKAELEDVDWRMVAQDRGQWRRVVHRAAETCSHPYPWNQGNKEEREKRLSNGSTAPVSWVSWASEKWLVDHHVYGTWGSVDQVFRKSKITAMFSSICRSFAKTSWVWFGLPCLLKLAASLHFTAYELVIHSLHYDSDLISRPYLLLSSRISLNIFTFINLCSRVGMPDWRCANLSLTMCLFLFTENKYGIWHFKPKYLFPSLVYYLINMISKLYIAVKSNAWLNICDIQIWQEVDHAQFINEDNWYRPTQLWCYIWLTGQSLRMCQVTVWK